MTIETILNKEIDKKFIIPSEIKRFNLNPSNYKFKLYNHNIENNFKLPKNILFIPNYTENGLFLGYKIDEKNKNNDQILNGIYEDKIIKYISVLCFNENEFYTDVLQIQGGRNSYKYLTPLYWDSLLLNRLINYSKERNLKEVRVVSSYEVNGDHNYANEVRFKKRYDDNAKKLGFNYSKIEKRFILKL